LKTFFGVVPGFLLRSRQVQAVLCFASSSCRDTRLRRKRKQTNESSCSQAELSSLYSQAHKQILLRFQNNDVLQATASHIVKLSTWFILPSCSAYHSPSFRDPSSLRARSKESEQISSVLITTFSG